MSENVQEGAVVGVTIAELSKEEEERRYRRGLQDYVAGNRDTIEAQHYVSYWVERDLGGVALQALAE